MADRSEMAGVSALLSVASLEGVDGLGGCDCAFETPAPASGGAHLSFGQILQIAIVELLRPEFGYTARTSYIAIVLS